jgi:hypothetical protein
MEKMGYTSGGISLMKIIILIIVISVFYFSLSQNTNLLKKTPPAPQGINSWSGNGPMPIHIRKQLYSTPIPR